MKSLISTYGLLVALSLLSLSAHSNSQEALPAGIASAEPASNFSEHVAKINASPAFFEALAKQEDNSPIINLNLLRYRPRGDSSRYDLYGAAAGKEIAGLGGDIVFHGKAITDMPSVFQISNEWDGVAFALYPRRSAYLQLQKAKDYQLAIPDRVAGTYARMLYVLSDGTGIFTAENTVESFHKNGTRVSFEEGNVVISEFLKFKENGGKDHYQKYAAKFAPLLKKAGGSVVLSANTEMPIVSERYWDHFVAFRFPSLDAMKTFYNSDGFQEANSLRIAALADQLTVLSEPEAIPGGK